MVQKEIKPQDKSYWLNRPLKDKEHDWLDDSVNWVQGYVNSVSHPHRDLIIDALKNVDLKRKSLLEIGCNAGPNLIRIEEQHPFADLYGFDINADSIKLAKKTIPTARFLIGDVHFPPFIGKFDVLLADAVLMYVNPKDIDKVMTSLDLMTKRMIIIIDRFNKGKEIAGHVWARDYGALLKKMNYTVTTKKITQKNWPTSKNWQKYGYIWIAKKI